MQVLSYTGLLLSGKPNPHLNEIDNAANAQMELLIKQMTVVQRVTDELKAMDQIAWGRWRIISVMHPKRILSQN